MRRETSGVTTTDIGDWALAADGTASPGNPDRRSVGVRPWRILSTPFGKDGPGRSTSGEVPSTALALPGSAPVLLVSGPLAKPRDCSVNVTSAGKTLSLSPRTEKDPSVAVDIGMTKSTGAREAVSSLSSLVSSCRIVADDRSGRSAVRLRRAGSCKRLAVDRRVSLGEGFRCVGGRLGGRGQGRRGRCPIRFG
jgi:hypothetical protein